MARALSLARRAQGRVEPNPLVGAVVVRDSRIVGQGYHHQFGGPHAEVFALQDAGSRAKGATLYVTLEPCCHWGKTPPCTDAVLAAGIRRVVIAMIDPFARVHGKGAKLLRRHGLRVDVGLLESEARALNAPFITRLTYGRPFVIAKWAQSIDGCVATASGESRWISSPPSRAFAHSLRARVDAVIVGLGTALADDPLLTARLPNNRKLARLATRIVVDSECRLPPASQLLRTVADAPLLIAHAKSLNRPAEKRRRLLAARGAMTVALPSDNGRPRIAALLRHLGRLDYTNVLVEGGPELLASFSAADLIDEAHVFIAPILIGGANARHAIAGPDLRKLSHAHTLRFLGATPSGLDVHLHLRRPEATM
jgi:diaminohydroxyphosphoribosylaminopyrimidine deaminase/5-amino-6-(5-phosphoribosylamino)uracil reductase